MLALELDQVTELKFNKLLNLFGKNYNLLIDNIFDYRIKELEKGLRNIKLDLLKYESKYNLKTEDFYKRFQNSEFGEDSDCNDFLIWSGLYESYLEFNDELKLLL